MLVPRLFIFAAILVFTLSSSAQDSEKISLSSWKEAVVTTQNPQPWLDLMIDYAGWKIVSDGQLDKGLAASWGAPKNASAREILLANPSTERGFLRLIHFTGFEQDWIRSDDRPWDTGGLFDVNIRVKDLLTAHKTLRALGWQGDSAPNQITFGPYEVIEWIARGPDGVRFAFIERLKPKLEGYEFERLSRLFNSTQTVADMDRSLAYFRDVLGMQIQLEHNAASKEAGPNVLGLPHEITTEIPRTVYILNGDDSTEGKIELLSFNGATGSDFSAKAQPTNIGLSVLRFQVDDLTAVMTALEARGAQFLHAPIEVELAPYGKVTLTALRAPEGSYLEIYQALDL